MLDTLDLIRESLNSSSSRSDRLKIGQFLTPSKTAIFMASLFSWGNGEVRILDPGAGAGVLFGKCVEALTSLGRRSSPIKVVAYENDERILPHLTETMKKCESMCERSRIPFCGEIREEDFVAAAAQQTKGGLFSSQGDRFTHVILNPPYKKINGQSSTRRSLATAGIEVSNLYAAFVWLAARMLEPGGQLVAITPRSFCNGPYFRRFRVALLNMMSLRRIHVFESRNKAFGDDDVLQENVIYHAILSGNKPERMTISSSEGLDFDKASIRSVPYEQVVLPGDRDSFIHLALNGADETIMDQMRRFSLSLYRLGLDVSTGRIVDFRAREYLRAQPEEATAPLIYPAHFDNGFIHWPVMRGKKPNAIVVSEKTRDLLVPSGHYVLTKRFSAKEERKRVVAAIYDPSRIDAPVVGFENHLNYFHSRGKALPETLAKGLTVYLNSSLFDRYFRLFNGHTQVNATDLRKMRYPSREQLLRLGAHMRQWMPDQEALDLILEKECQIDG
jgi:adenine-specific DNA-methyltransferase